MVRKAGTGRKGGRKGGSKASLASSPSSKSQETIKDVLMNVSEQTPSQATPEINPSETEPIKAVPLRQTPSKENVLKEKPASPSKTKTLTPSPQKSKSKKAPKEKSIETLTQITETVSSNPKSPSEGEPVKKIAKKLEKQLEELADEGLDEEKEDKKMEEDLDVVVTKVVAGTTTGSVRKRQTRAASKVIKGSEEKETTPSEPKRGEKRKATSSVSRISKAAKGKQPVNPSTGATSLSSRTVLSGCGVENEYFDIPALSQVKELLEFQGWMSLFNDLNDAFVGPVRQFFVNLKQNIDMSVASTVSGSIVHVSESVLSELLGIPRDGFGRYSSDGWPLMGGVTPEEVTQFLFGKKEEAGSPSDFREAIMLVLHSMCLKVFLPKGQGRGTVRIMDMVLIYLILKKVKVNLPALMMEHMLYCHASSHNSLPYGSFICKIIKEQNPKFSFSGEVVSLQLFSKKILTQKKIDYSGKRLTFVGQESSPRDAGNQEEITPEDVAMLLAKLERQDERIIKLAASLVQAEEERKLDKLMNNRKFLTICRVIDHLLPPESGMQFDSTHCRIIETDDEESSSEKGPDAEKGEGSEEEENESDEEEEEETEEKEKKEEEKTAEEGSDFEEEINPEDEEEDEDDDE